MWSKCFGLYLITLAAVAQQPVLPAYNREQWGLRPQRPPRKLNNCCLRGGDGLCPRPNMRWFEGNNEYDVDWSFDTYMRIVVTFLTNAAGIPSVVRGYRGKDYCMAFVGAFTAATSSMYHLGDSIDHSVLGMTPGNWHRLDNVGAVLVLSFLCLHLLVLSPERKEKYRWSILVFTLILNELAPWALYSSVLPIATGLVLLLRGLCSNPSLRAALSPFNNGNIRTSLILFICAIGCFIMGLDEHKDPFRAIHGCWHIFAGSGYYYGYKSVDSLSFESIWGKPDQVETKKPAKKVD